MDTYQTFYVTLKKVVPSGYSRRMACRLFCISPRGKMAAAKPPLSNIASAGAISKLWTGVGFGGLRCAGL